MSDGDRMSAFLKDKRIFSIVLANFFTSVGSGVSTIAITFLILDKVSGEQILGAVMLGTTVAVFILSPYIGVIVDRYSRKNILLFNQLLGFFIMFPIAVWGFFGGQYYTWQLVIMSFATPLYFSFYFPTLIAFVQEVFDRSTYHSLSGVMEVASQAAAVGAGGIAGVLLSYIDYAYIFLFNGIIYLVSFAIISFIPYEKTFTDREETMSFWSGHWRDLQEGFAYLKKRRALVMYLLCSFMPFLTIMVGNYIDPVYIYSVLKEGPDVLGFMEMIYAIGAVAAGFAIPFLLKKTNAFWTTLITVILFTIAVFSRALFPIVAVFLTLTILQGWGNAGTRVVRRIVMLELVPNHLMGRVNAFFETTGLLIRIVLIASFTTVIDIVGATVAWFILGIFMIAAVIGLVKSRSLFIDGESVEGVQSTTGKIV